MTRYLCVDQSHRRHGDVIPVDVTAQVRTERAMLPSPSAYFALTEDIIASVAKLGQSPSGTTTEGVSRLLSGVTEPQDLPVILMSQHSVTRAPGQYEIDDLAATEPAVARVTSRLESSHVFAGPSDDLVIMDDAESGSTTVVGTPSQPTAVLTRPSQRTRVVPQGVFELGDLAARLAVAEPTEDASIDAIRSAPLYDVRAGADVTPWRVVITCPKAEGSPATAHATLFTGTGAPEAAVAYGTPADGWDLTLETSALSDMAPAVEVGRIEHRIWTMIGVETLVITALLAFGWASGALRLAARETPGWLGLSLVVAAAAVAFGAIPLFAVRDPAANMNDTFVLRALYESRIVMLRWAAAISAVLFGLALMSGVIPPLSAEGRSVPAASVAFNTTGQPVTATMKVAATDIGAGHAVNVTMREYAAGDQVGTLVGDVTRNGDPSGAVAIAETFALDTNARYVSVMVTMNGKTARDVCGPAATGVPGCTVVAVPAPAAAAPQQVTNIVTPPAITLPSPSPSSVI
ncbi:MAG: hypothetical protein QOI81_2231 [Actinomycetota bacterium]|nr:hypothetical protein [Actinomycetota bacterium]